MGRCPARERLTGGRRTGPSAGPDLLILTPTPRRGQARPVTPVSRIVTDPLERLCHRPEDGRIRQ